MNKPNKQEPVSALPPNDFTLKHNQVETREELYIKLIKVCEETFIKLNMKDLAKNLLDAVARIKEQYPSSTISDEAGDKGENEVDSWIESNKENIPKFVYLTTWKGEGRKKESDAVEFLAWINKFYPDKKYVNLKLDGLNEIQLYNLFKKWKLENL